MPSMCGHLAVLEDAGDPGALFKIGDVPLQGIDEAQIVQHPGAQAGGQAPDLINGVVDEPAHGQSPVAGLGVLRPAGVR